jgi:leucyl aminopeptidase
METEVQLAEKLTAEGPAALIVPIAEGHSGPLSDHLGEADARVAARALESGVFKGKAGDVYCFPAAADGLTCVVLVGIGKGAVDAELLRRAGGKIVEALACHRIATCSVDLFKHSDWPCEALLEGITLGQYRFEKYRKPSEDAPAVSVGRFILLTSDDAVRLRCNHAVAVCENANWARDLANRSSNDLTPGQLAFEARSIAEHHDFCSYDFIDEGRMLELGMNAMLGVTRGATEPAKIILLNYHCCPEAPTLAIVGKGITFDTGGVSIKPSEGMQEMKFDMCGAAAVLGAMRTVVQMRPAINVVCVAPAAENVVGSRAQKPGDIVRAYNGKTIEVNNTDAEGRLILADALAYTVEHYQPDKVVDLATLTGAAIVALGHYAAGVMSTDDPLYASLQAAADATGERIWRLPLWDDYSKLIEGTHGDLSNIGPAREAGTIMGGCFLKEFVGDTPWAHIDIAGTAWGGKNIPYLNPKHATGYGVRMLSEWIRREAFGAK